MASRQHSFDDGIFGELTSATTYRVTMVDRDCGLLNFMWERNNVVHPAKLAHDNAECGRLRKNQENGENS